MLGLHRGINLLLAKMNYSTSRLTLLAITVATASLVGACSKETSQAELDAKAGLENTFKAPKLPSIYENAQYKVSATEVDTAAKALIALAKSTKDVEKLTPAIQAFVAKRDALLSSITDSTLRQAAFSEVMQKNIHSPDDRKAYAEAMTSYYKATGAAHAKAVVIKPANLAGPVAATSPAK